MYWYQSKATIDCHGPDSRTRTWEGSNYSIELSFMQTLDDQGKVKVKNCGTIPCEHTSQFLSEKIHYYPTTIHNINKRLSKKQVRGLPKCRWTRAHIGFNTCRINLIVTPITDFCKGNAKDFHGCELVTLTIIIKIISVYIWQTVLKDYYAHSSTLLSSAVGACGRNDNIHVVNFTSSLEFLLNGNVWHMTDTWTMLWFQVLHHYYTLVLLLQHNFITPEGMFNTHVTLWL